VTTAVIVQARMGSIRLPGKVMKDLAGKSVLAHVLGRCQRIAGADVVVCAVPDEDKSAPLERVASQCGVRVFRGSECDVLARFEGAARCVEANVIMRVTSDCPLIDPDVCGRLVKLRDLERADYASNVHPRSFPQGLDCEIFTMAALQECAATASDAYDREHVTPWMARVSHLRRANLESGRPELSDLRWTLDYPEDLDFLQAVYGELRQEMMPGMDRVLHLLAERPDIARINAHRRQAASASVV